MRRGGRGGFNGNKGPSVASIVGDTMNEVGEKNYNNEDESSLFPSVSIPNPADLTERDIYLVQKQRELWYNAETRMDSQDQSGAINLSAYPITQPARNILFNTDNVATEVILPPELLVTYNGQGRPDTLIMSKKDGIGSGFLQPKAFESTISALEKKEVSGHKVADDYISDDATEDDLGDEMNDYQVDYYDSDDNVSDDGNDLGDVF